MALSIVCPGCDADYAVPENLIGKSIRCKKCGETIAVKAAKPKAKARVTADDEDDDTPRRPARRNRDEDEDDYDAPAKKKSKGISPLLIGGLAALILAGGGVAAYVAFSGDKKDDQVVSAPPVKPVTPVDPAPEEKTDAEAGKGKTETVTPKEESKKSDAVPEKPATKPVKKKPDAPKKEEPKPGMLTAAGVANQPGGYENGLSLERYRSGDMPPIVLAQVKKASVFIKTEMEGGAATGSGWFGIEPGIVFTNAHVLNMKAPNAPPPKRLTFYLNSGTPEQRMIPNANIKILAVDRDIDIACLQVINEKDLPLPLKVRPSHECTEGLGLNTIGYPFGYMPGQQFAGSGKEPAVSIRRTTITAFRNNDFGILRRVQVEGAANPGNSGGPVVDAEGSVCCVIVEGVGRSGNLMGMPLTGCVPTEYTFGLLAGRVADVEYGMPYKADGKVRLPVKAQCLDPMNRLKKVGIMAWVGNSSEKYRAPGPNKPEAQPGDIHFQDLTLTLDPKTHIASGELELPLLEGDTVYWGQPYYENVVFPHYYEPGRVIDTHGPVADRIPALLTYKPRLNTTRVVTLQNTSDLEEAFEDEGEAKNQRERLRIGMRVRETTQGPPSTDTVPAARLIYKFDELEMPKVVIGDTQEHDAMSKGLLAQINTYFKQAGAYALVNKRGAVYKPGMNTLNITTLEAKFFVALFSSDALEALKYTSIEMPDPETDGKALIQPGFSWKWPVDQSISFQDRPPQMRQGNGANPNAQVKLPPPRIYRFQEEYVAKFIGVRERAGTKEAVIEISGKAKRAPAGKYDAHGDIKGRVLVELDTGVVLEADIERDITVDTSERGMKKSASGLYHYRLTRGPVE